jgi:hypothetical protein
MLRLRASPVLGGSALQCLNDILGNVSYQELWHVASTVCYHMIAAGVRTVQICARGGVRLVGALDFRTVSEPLYSL